MSLTKKLILITLLSSFIVNTGMPKTLSECSSIYDISYQVIYNPISLHYTSMSFFTLKIISSLLSESMGLSKTAKNNSKPVQNKKADRTDSSSDYYMANDNMSQNIRKAFFEGSTAQDRFILPVSAANFSGNILFNMEAQFFVFLLLILMMFFLLPRGAIDNIIYANINRFKAQF